MKAWVRALGVGAAWFAAVCASYGQPALGADAHPAKASGKQERRTCWCADDYDPKPPPAIMCRRWRGTCDHYDRKPPPRVRPARQGCKDDYCPKPWRPEKWPMPPGSTCGRPRPSSRHARN